MRGKKLRPPTRTANPATLNWLAPVPLPPARARSFCCLGCPFTLNWMRTRRSALALSTRVTRRARRSAPPLSAADSFSWLYRMSGVPGPSAPPEEGVGLPSAAPRLSLASGLREALRGGGAAPPPPSCDAALSFLALEVTIGGRDGDFDAGALAVASAFALRPRGEELRAGRLASGDLGRRRNVALRGGDRRASDLLRTDRGRRLVWFGARQPLGCTLALRFQARRRTGLRLRLVRRRKAFGWTLADRWVRREAGGEDRRGRERRRDLEAPWLQLRDRELALLVDLRLRLRLWLRRRCLCRRLWWRWRLWLRLRLCERRLWRRGLWLRGMVLPHTRQQTAQDTAQSAHEMGKQLSLPRLFVGADQHGETKVTPCPCHFCAIGRITDIGPPGTSTQVLLPPRGTASMWFRKQAG